MTAGQMAGQHDFLLVALPVLIAMIAVYAVLPLARHITAAVAAARESRVGKRRDIDTPPVLGMATESMEQSTEERLRRSERFLKQSQEVARVGSWEWDIVPDVVTWSDELYRLYGLEPQSRPITYETFLQLCHPDDRDRVRTTVEQAYQTHERYEVDHRVVWPDGTVRTLHGRGGVLLDQAGTPVRMTGTCQDITERRQLEERVRLSQRLEAVGQLAGGVAHDFNNLLTAVLSYSDLLLAELGPDDPHREDVAEIKRAGERGAALTQQLLAFSRRQVVQPKVLDLNAVVTNLEPMLRRLIRHDIALNCRLARPLGRVRADAGQLDQVIVNLVVNARDALPRGGTIHIETMNVELDQAYAQQHPPTLPDRYVRLAISDTGTGMDEHTKAHLFEPFFTTKEAGKGTGLGLATVYGIVKQSGGYIWVDSELGRGTTCRIYLPRVDQAPDAPNTVAGADGDRRGTETVLLVDDDPAVRKATRMILARGGYTVLEAATGREALQLSEQYHGPIHLVLTDVVMPEVSGPELIKHLRVGRPEMAPLLMSGYTGDVITRDGVREAGAGFLEKPFTPSGLLAAVRNILDGNA